MPNPRKPRIPQNARPASKDSRQGGFEFGAKTNPAGKEFERAKPPAATTRTHTPAVKIGGLVVRSGGREHINWLIKTIETPKSNGESEILIRNLKKIMESARTRRINQIIFSIDEERGVIPTILKDLGFTVKKDSSGGYTREDTYYIFTYNVR